MKINNKYILFGAALIVQFLISCNWTNQNKKKNIDLSFEYIPEGGKVTLLKLEKEDADKGEIVEARENNNTIEISVFKFLGIPIDGYNGKCEIKKDTLYLYYWEEIKEANRNKDHLAVILQSELKYKIKKVKYNNVKIMQLNDKYIK